MYVLPPGKEKKPQAVCLTYSSDSGQRTKEDKVIYIFAPSGEAECGAIAVNLVPLFG